MLREEWRSLFHNKILLLVVLVIALIPAIYAGLFLASMWDPYGNIDKLPVAVVNTDQSVEYNGTTLDVGDNLVEKLKENDALAFNFVDEDVADVGLRNGTYYMVITIPENFSANAATLMDNEPKKMELEYKTNPGTNYIASKLSETALGKIRTSVADEVTKTYTQAVFDQISTVGDGMETAADGAQQIQDGVTKSAEGNGKITQNLKKLANSTLTFSNGAETLTEGLKTYTDGVGQVDEGASQLNQGVSELTEKVPTLLTGVEELNSGVIEYTDGVAKLNANSETLKGGAKKLQQGAKELETGLQTLAAGTTKYTGGVEELAGGVAEYVGGVEKISTASQGLAPLESLGEAYDGICRLSAAVSDGTPATEKTPEVPALKAGTQQLEDGLKELAGQVGNMAKDTDAEGNPTLTGGLKSAIEGMKAASEGMGEAGLGMIVASGTMAEASEICGEVAAALQEMPATVGNALTQYTSVLDGAIADANGQLETANVQIQTANEQIASTDAGLSAAADELSGLQASIDEGEMVDLSGVINTLYGLMNNGTLGETTPVDSSVYEAQNQQITDGITATLTGSLDSMSEAEGGLTLMAAGLLAGADELSKGAIEISDGSEELSKGVQEMGSGVEKLQAGVDALYVGAQKVNNGTGEIGANLKLLKKSTSAFPEAADGIRQLLAGFQQLTANDKTLLSGAQQLRASSGELNQGAGTAAKGASTLSDGMNSLAQGVGEYTDGVAQLNSNSAKLKSGTSQLADGAATLSTGAKKLGDGTQQLYAGTQQLMENNDSLNSGAKQLSDGAVQIQDGAGKLYDGSKELGTGLTKLDDGSKTLQTKLADGATQVKETTTSDSTVEMFASPVEESETKLTEVKNNGHAMAPYMMSVGLWVGSLAFCLMYPLTKYRGKLKSGFSWWFSKASILYPLAVLQGILLIILLHKIDGFAPVEFEKTIVFACLASMAFTSIMYFFNISLGKVGSFLMLVFMVVQLAGSAGTYPVQVSPEFVSKIHNWVPFTYTVNAFRSTICGGESIEKSIAVMIGLILVFSLLTILEFQYRAVRIKKSKPLLIDFLEEKGLA